jgi:hypothetical protein
VLALPYGAKKSFGDHISDTVVGAAVTGTVGVIFNIVAVIVGKFFSRPNIP